MEKWIFKASMSSGESGNLRVAPGQHWLWTQNVTDLRAFSDALSLFFHSQLILFFCRFCGRPVTSVVSSSLWPHGLQHARPSCPSPSPGVCPSSRPLHWWCHPAISSSDSNSIYQILRALITTHSYFPHSQRSVFLLLFKNQKPLKLDEKEKRETG